MKQFCILPRKWKKENVICIPFAKCRRLERFKSNSHLFKIGFDDLRAHHSENKRYATLTHTHKCNFRRDLSNFMYFLFYSENSYLNSIAISFSREEKIKNKIKLLARNNVFAFAIFEFDFIF